MSEELRIGILTVVPLLLQLIGLLFVVLIDPYISKRNTRIMIAIIITVFLLITQNIAEYILTDNISIPLLRTVVGIIGYSLRPVILVLFLMIVSGRINTWNALVLVGVNAAIYLTALFTGLTFSIDAGNNFHRGPLGYTAHFISILLLLYLLYASLKRNRESRGPEIFIPIVNVAIIIATIIMDLKPELTLDQVDYLTVAVVTGSLFYYIWLHLKFVREHEQSMQAEQRIQIMMSQIQPHFLYNTLSTIQALCRTDPEKAEVVTERFGTYLRQNLDSLNQTELIDIEKEIEHTRVYSDIESVRFPKIKVSYDIMDTDFKVPALSIQPLVENAIRHGVRGLDNGHVEVITRAITDGHEIIVRDNGKGFDIEKMEELGGAHIGLRNVRERIEKMCGGTLDVNANRSSGVMITIRIPYFVGHLLDT